METTEQEHIDRKTGKGRFLCKKEWGSICSAHFIYDKNCSACNSGRWYNNNQIWINNIIFKISPKFWMWWMNKK